MERPDHDLPDDDDATVNPSANPTFQAILAARMSRRGFLAGGAAGLAALATGRLGARSAEAQAPLPFTPVVASNEDKLILPPGYTHSVLLRWGDPIFPDGVRSSTPRPRRRRSRSASSAATTTSSASCRSRGAAPRRTRGLLGVNHENVRPGAHLAHLGRQGRAVRARCATSRWPPTASPWSRSCGATGASGAS